ncbi:tight adherence protein B [Caldalkalibacillus uzonensis]|uniref:Tight adherence protein B n=1 Tax=Caldalkalibacillus uzonensis TaxID=353224 RepID=A0ABU0CS74_9BACI|nr:type II secretion system F family protein [Caldalkalibacillus uzonensis]MDQ0337877.1 tight adherence protein B [Caldalkalibacillus uzonensis]
MGLIYLALSTSILIVCVSIYYALQYRQSKKASKRVRCWFEDGETKRKSFIFIIGDKYDQSELSESLRDKLTKANINMKASEYAGICVLIFLVLWAVNHFILALLFPLDMVLAHVLVWGGSTLFLKSRQNKRSQAFNQQLPDICRMMANTVKAGLTLQQGIDMVAKELKEPAGSEFAKMTHELRLGDSFDEVMNRFKGRIVSKELQIFVNTILIQRRVGGNLAEVLNLMAETLEERARIHKEIDAITAESRYVAFILPVLPVVMALMLNLLIPGFLNPLFTPLGLILLAVVGGIQLISFLLIRKISTIRV